MSPLPCYLGLLGEHSGSSTVGMSVLTEVMSLPVLPLACVAADAPGFLHFPGPFSQCFQPSCCLLTTELQ